jgi:hypothetical protein
MLGYRWGGMFSCTKLRIFIENIAITSLMGDRLTANSNRVAVERSKVMKQLESTSCLPNLQGEQRITVQGLLRIQPFTPKSVNGKAYWITRAEVSVRTAVGNSTRAMGIILDKIRGWEYALSIADFNRFIETGDLSLLPKGSTSSSKARKPRLIELSLMRPEKVL